MHTGALAVTSGALITKKKICLRNKWTHVIGEVTAALPATAVCGGLATGWTAGGEAGNIPMKEISKWRQAQNVSPTPQYPGNFNDTKPEILPVYTES